MAASLISNLENAILLKDMRSRMRGVRPFVVLVGNCALMFVVTFSWWIDHKPYERYYQLREMMDPGRHLLSWLMIAQALVITFLAPALTSGAFTLEREQQSFELLLLTPMSPLRMVWGRIASVALFLILIITSTVPFVALCFLLGGLSPGELLAQYVSLALASFLLSAVGVLCSVSSSRTPFAIVKAFLATMALSLALAIPGGIFISMGTTAVPQPSPVTLVDYFAGSLHATGAAPFFNTTIPAWICGFIIELMLIALFTMLAANSFPTCEGNLTGALRVLSFILFLLAYFTMMACIWGLVGRATVVAPSPAPPTRPLGMPIFSSHRFMANGLIGVGFALIGLFAPLFCSQRLGSVATVARAESFRRTPFLLQARLVPGVVFVFLSACTVLPGVWLAFRLGNVPLFQGGSAYLLAITAFSFAVLAFIVLSTLLGCALFRPYRMVGVACGYVAIVMAGILTVIPNLVYESSVPWSSFERAGPHPTSANLIVLNPFAVGMASSTTDQSPQHFHNGGPLSNVPIKQWCRVGTLGYLCLDLGLLLCLMACLLAMRREAQRDAAQQAT